ncbi:MAG TPA: Calx-beta domain-containing protein, partial [Acidimicrobiales bacterium]|nr:Calx-beta domain-containing protein [Acidimicrobiales bacterium]
MPPFVEVDPDSVPADRLRVIAVVDDTLESWPSTVYVPVKVGKPSVAVHVGAQAIGLSWSSADARLDATYLVEEEDGADWVAVPGTSLSADGTTVGIPYEPVDADSTRTYRVTRVRHLADGAHASIPSDPVEAHLRVLPQAPTVIQPVCGGEAPVNCVESEAGNTYTIQWSPIPGDDTWPVAADRYEVEIALADGWLRLPDTAFPATAGQVDGVFQARADHRIDIYLRLVAVAADGRESLPSQAIDIYQPGEPPVGPDDPDPDAPPLSIRFVQTGEPEGTDVVTDDDRIPNDMLGYTDGAFGFTPGSNGMVDVHASVGDISITEGTRDNLLDTVIARTDINAGDCSEACEGNQGGPTYVDPATGEQITFYHSEDYRLGYTDSGGHFNAVGMAYAPAGSTAFERRGFVYETEQRRDSGHTNAESGTGQFVVKDGYIYLYFTDSPDDETVHHEGMGVARAPVAEVLAAARDDDHLQVPGEDGNPPAFDGLFKKYYDADPADDQPGAFSENAIGGRSTEVSKSGGGGSVVYDACMDEVWIVTADNIEGGPPPAPAGGWPVATSITVSPDGIHFDAPETIAITHGDRVYSTPAWRDARDPMVIRGDQFDVFARRHPRTDAARDDHTINRLSFRDTLASQGCLGQPDSNGDPAEPVRDTRPKLSVTPATTAYEQVGGGLARFDLSLDVPLDHDLTVSYWTSDRTATAVRGEYEPAGTQASPETLTIPAGDVQATVTVPVLDADAPVSYHPQYGNPLPEQFALHIRTADGTVQMGRTLGVATIIDRATPDGTVPWLRLTPTVQVHDGDSGTRTATVTLVLSQPVAQDVTVRLSTSDLTAHAGVHYEAV